MALIGLFVLQPYNLIQLKKKKTLTKPTKNKKNPPKPKQTKQKNKQKNNIRTPQSVVQHLVKLPFQLKGYVSMDLNYYSSQEKE